MISIKGEQTTDLNGLESIGHVIYQLIEKLFPICRSITGEGVRKSLRILKEEIPLEMHEVPSGTLVLDWTVPREWNINEAWIKGPNGKKIVDFQDHNLHVLNYSTPIHQFLPLSQLKKHLYSIPEQPDLIPYRTSYYKETWGFCMSHRELRRLPEGQYEVYIDSSLKDGALTYGELYIPGKIKDEVLFSAHICHPSLANDNLSGVALATHLAKKLLKTSNRHSYRFLFIPGTIGAITWLALNRDKLVNVKHGLVISLVGDPGDFTYKKSRRGNAEIDEIAEYVLNRSGHPYRILDFFPYGYDERQFCSPGFNLPVGNLTRSQFGEYSEYHTSGDNLELVQPDCLDASFYIYIKIIEILEGNQYFRNIRPYGEPQLGRRGLYEAIGGQSDQKKLQMAMLWVLNLSDGKHSLLDICQKSGYDFSTIYTISELLLENNLLTPVWPREHFK